MMIQVVSEYNIDPDDVVAEYPEFWNDYKRWNGDDEEGFLLMMLSNMFTEVMEGREPDYSQVDYV